MSAPTPGELKRSKNHIAWIIKHLERDLRARNSLIPTDDPHSPMSLEGIEEWLMKEWGVDCGIMYFPDSSELSMWLGVHRHCFTEVKFGPFL